MAAIEKYNHILNQFRQQGHIFRAVQADYRLRKVDDATYLAARARYMELSAKLDAAEAEVDDES